MKNVFSFFSLLGLWVILCPTARAEFQVPTLTGRVVDAGGVFTPEDAQRIEQTILKLEEATGGQMVVATLPTLGGITIEEAGIKLGDAWKIGHAGKDDGAILLFVVPESKMRLEIGRGWEGPVNDARAGDVIRALVPFFKAEKYADGAIYAVEKVQEFVTGDPVEAKNSLMSPEGRKLAPEEESIWMILLGVLVFIAFFVPILWLVLWPLAKIFIILPCWFILWLILRLFRIPFPAPDLDFLFPYSGGSGGSGGSSGGWSGGSSGGSSGGGYSGGGGSFGGGGASGSW
ncbi:MAG: TPM domain-containing protein [Thermoguttaceae bacterium]|nr:TPM domain-containing protein [Thermoguttaceae bacterium]